MLFLWRKDVRAGYFITGVLILFTLLTTLSDRCLLIYYHGIPKTTLIFLSFNYQTITSVLVLYLSKLYFFFPTQLGTCVLNLDSSTESSHVLIELTRPASILLSTFTFCLRGQRV